MIKIEVNNNKESYWHSNIKIINNGVTLYLSENPSGCGQMILHEWAWGGNNKRMKDSLLYLLDIIQNKKGKLDKIPYYSSLDIGSIITTVGKNFYTGEKLKILEELGFKCISEYKNPRHNIGYTQKLYIWTIK